MNVKKCVRALLCLYLTLIIATDAVKAQTLKVGDTLPPELWSMPLQVVNHPEGKETITLNEYKDKLIILDFWATWCAPCIKSLAKLDTLQKEFSEQLAVIPITYEAGEKIQAFISKKGWRLPAVVGDTMVKKWFPHRYIPHYVWINRGAVSAITGHEAVNKEELLFLFKNGVTNAVQKEDLLGFDVTKPIFFSKSTMVDASIEQYSVISGPIKGLNRMHSGMSNASKELYDRIFAINCSILELYMLAYEEVSKFPANRIVLNVSNPDNLLRSGKKEKRLDNLYCYEKLGRPIAVKDLKSTMARDLDTYFNLITKVESRVTECYVLRSTGARLSEGGESGTNVYENENKEIWITNYPVSVLTGYLNANLPIYTLDESGLSGNIDIRLPNLNSAGEDELNAALYTYGFELVKEKRELTFFVITEN